MSKKRGKQFCKMFLKKRSKTGANSIKNIFVVKKTKLALNSLMGRFFNLYLTNMYIVYILIEVMHQLSRNLAYLRQNFVA